MSAWFQSVRDLRKWLLTCTAVGTLKRDCSITEAKSSPEEINASMRGSASSVPLLVALWHCALVAAKAMGMQGMWNPLTLALPHLSKAPKENGDKRKRSEAPGRMKGDDEGGAADPSMQTRVNKGKNTFFSLLPSVY
jgi:hypothetical protein